MEALLIVIFIIILVIAIKNNAQADQNNNVACKMHKWVDIKQPDIDDTYMLCTVCNKTPSQIINEIPVDKA